MRAWMANPRKSRRRRSNPRKKARTAAQKAATKRMLAANAAKKSGRKVKRARAAAPLQARPTRAPSKKTRAKRPSAKARAAAAAATPSRKKCSRTWTGAHNKWAEIPAHYRRINPEENPMRRRRRRHVRRRHNPSINVKDGLFAVLFGGAAALVGTLGGFALVKAGLTNKWAAAGAHAAMGTVAGGAIGMISPAAGTIVSHNFMLNAANWLMAPSAPSAPAAAPKVSGVYDEYGNILADDMGSYASLNEMGTVLADDFADVGAIPDEY